MSVINTNITSMIGQQNLNSSRNDLQTSMERLSSGLRINSAKDDAAGQAIANRMSAQITGLSTAQRNANDGISVAQTAEGALNQVNDNLQRVRELTVQAQNGTNSQEDLQSIQDEIGQRLGEINRISEETNFNGTKVLSESTSSIAIQVGANDGETISVDLQTINQKTLELDGFDITNTLQQVSAGDNAYTGDAITFDGASGSDFMKESSGVAAADIDASATNGLGKATFGGKEVIATASLELREFDGQQYAVDTTGSSEEVYTIESTNVDGSNNLNVVLGEKVSDDLAREGDQRGSSFNFTGGDSETSYSVVTDGSDNFVRAEKEGAETTYTKITAIDIESDAKGVVEIEVGSGGDLATGATNFAAETLDPMAQLDDALSKVDSLRSDLGAVQNRFESAITNLSTNETNLSAARSRIEDADYATEVANMTKNQILQQAGTSVLAQANQLPQSVLSLLG